MASTGRTKHKGIEMSSLEIFIYIISIILLICVSGTFSGTETAITAVSKARLTRLSKDNDKKATALLGLLENTERIIGVLLLGNNFVNILASALATSLFLYLFGEAGVIATTIIMTILVVIFAEVMPKVYALSNSERTALFIYPILRYVVLMLTPLNVAVMSVVNVLLKPLGLDKKDISEEHEEELRGAIELHDGEDPDYKHERNMLRSIMDLDDMSINECLTHRQNVTSLDINQDIETILNTVIQSGYSHFPLTDGAENIIGVIREKSLLREYRRSLLNNKQITLNHAVLEPWFVQESTSILDQLQSFRDTGNHMAIVVDEYGSYMGVITLKDILTVIVGDVQQTGTLIPNIRSLADGTYLFDGDEPIRNINRELDWDISDEYASTIAGYLIHCCQTLPQQGQVFKFDNMEFTVAKRERQQITKLRIRKCA